MIHLLSYRWCRWVFVLLIAGWSSMAVGQNVNYKSQSLYIYQFTKYITWPAEARTGDFVIGVYGNCPIQKDLELMAALKRAGSGQKIVVKHIRSLDELDGLHVLYLASSKSRDLRSILERLEGKPTLVVAERGGLAKKGACINFITLDNDSLRFEINTDTMKAHQLVMAEELLKRGYIVH